MNDINAYLRSQLPIRLLMIRQALEAETRGWRLTRKAPTGLSICKKEFGLKARTAAEMLPKYQKLLDDAGIRLAGDQKPSLREVTS